MSSHTTTYSARRAIVIFLVTIAILALGARQVISAIKPLVGQRYFARGITYLKAQDFNAAQKEFQKSLAAGDGEASDWLIRTEQAPTNPRIFETEWREWQIDSVTRLLTEATQSFTDPKTALATGITLFQSGQAPYAQYAVDTAITLDPAYPEAWHYRYLIYQDLARESAPYREKAEAARQTRDSLTSLYLNP